MRVFILLLLCICFSFNARAQNSPRPTYTLTPRLHYGYIWNFSREVSHLSTQHMPGFELNLTKQTKGSKGWQQEYNYPQVGYSLYYFAFDPQKPVGNALAVLIHAGKNLAKSKRANLQWRMGFGTAYVERRYEVATNFRNNVISQRMNFVLNGQVNFNYKISPSMLFNMGIGIVHISNGSLKKPNFGINLPSIHAGLGLNILKGDSEFKKDSPLSFKRKTYLHAGVFGGLKEVYPVNGPKYFLGGLNAYAERRINRKSGLNVGMDFSYDRSKQSEIKYDSINVSNVSKNYMQAGIIAGHELYIHRLSLLTQLGVYLYDPTHINKAIYQKVGFKYYLSEKVFVGMSMKVHFGIADWIEWGGGIRL